MAAAPSPSGHRTVLEAALSHEAKHEAEHLRRLGTWEWDAVRQRMVWTGPMYTLFGSGAPPSPEASALTEAQSRAQRYGEWQELMAKTVGIGLWQREIDSDGIGYWNDQMKLLFGYAADAPTPPVAEAWSHVLPEDRAPLQRLFKEPPPPGATIEHTYRIRRRDGALRTLFTRVAALYARDGHVVRLLGVTVDVTEQRATEQQLQAAQHERDVAERANQAQTEFLSRMSHELRTPLNAILGFTQILLLDPKHPVTAIQRERVQHIQESGQHLLALINGILDLSRAAGMRAADAPCPAASTPRSPGATAAPQPGAAIGSAVGSSVGTAAGSAVDSSVSPAIGPAIGPRDDIAGSVLYVEDNASNIAVVEEILSLRPNVRLFTARDGASARVLAAVCQPDLILLDMRLPDTDGLQLFHDLRQQPQTAGIRCVGVSASAMPSDVVRAHEAGFVDYWTKPLDAALFLRGIDRLLTHR